MKDTNSLSHTSYRCKYHIVMVPKYRRVVIYNKLRADINSTTKVFGIRNNEIFDKLYDQISMKEFVDSFTGSKE